MDPVHILQFSEIISTIVFTFLGVALMGLCWWLINRLTHFSVVKEIEEDQNTALAVLIGSVFLSLAIIIAAVIVS
ncbi:DUF350 domain-containing protein [Sagittula salina]|uniref:DUF350 domain-containing protein n=1 Tax=Sagittula salina TaxID=2820268 RepID=A0A940MMB7_9RHOB|nr:DUF350 domain-containing protein [Sagittula salina]MBP0484136.1 DUF350 domain-containing protein [Sagittula salina]